MIIRYLPFLVVVALNILAQITDYDMSTLKPYVLIGASILLLNLLFAFHRRIRSYFTYGVSGVALLGCASVFIFSDIGRFYLNHIIEGLYLGLFLVAFFPPLFKMAPFTFEYSVKSYPEAVTKGQQFLRINLTLNYMWAGIFGLALILTTLSYHSDVVVNTIVATLLPIILQLGIGLPLTLKLPTCLIQKVSGERLHFNSISDLFSAMPFGLNRKMAEGVNTVIQFHLTGEEAVKGFLTIKDQVCTYDEGVHSTPGTTIRCDSNLWLQISNGEVSGDRAYMNGDYQVEGDAAIMLRFADMFAPPQEKNRKKKKKEQAAAARNEAAFEYRSFAPGSIASIVVFDGGPRSDRLSKTAFMVHHFLAGAKAAGAQAEYIKLAHSDIKQCTGCYSCWTNTPGECIHKDDMTELRRKCREADLIVFASPLYIFNVTGIMKTFMDRLLPILKPYMMLNEQGDIAHPDRFPEAGEQGFVVFSAAGFPEVEHNFDALKSMYRCWDSHSENAFLMGEFFLTAAEMIAHPVYADRKSMIQDVCFRAGEQIVAEGRIDRDLMLAVQDPTVSKETFQMQADNFWEALEGKVSYLSAIDKLH